MNEWGKYSLPAMAKRYGRSIEGIKIMRQRLGLPDLINASDLLPLNQLIQELGLNYGYDVPRLKKAGMPIRYKTVITKRVAMVDLEEFWIFAEKFRDFFDFSRLAENALGIEPAWAKEKRRFDERRASLLVTPNTPWSPAEDALLRDLVKQYKYTWIELSQRLHRSEGAIQRRLCDLKIPDRPLKADNHTKWTSSEIDILTAGIKHGRSYELISADLGKSTKSIRGKVYSTYLTESLDKARQMIGRGKFGDNRPERQLKHKNVMTPAEKDITKNAVSYLSGILVVRMKQLSGVGTEFSEYWQKDMCQHWSDIKGCTKGEIDCDSCTSFARILPQSCKRCGATFFMREKSLYCSRCIEQRRNQHKKKVAFMLAHNKW